VCLVAPYPFGNEPLDEFDVTRDFDITDAGEVWYARPQLFFKCTLCPTGILLPSLYVCPVENVLGRVPLIPCYLDGNTSNTIPHTGMYSGAIPAEAAADSSTDSGTGSRLFEINIWMWRYGRTFPRDVTVADAVAMRKQRIEESRARGPATLQRRREQAPGPQ
jgi:hypothetical protein